CGDCLHTVWHKYGVMMATWFQGTINEFIEPNKKATNAASEPFTSSAACRSRSKASARYPKSRQQCRNATTYLKKGAGWLSVGYHAAANQGGTMFKTSLSRRSFWMVATWLLFVASSQIISAQDRAAISLDPIAWTPIGPAPSVNGQTTFLENTS